jgi:CubicO group peptidase (beta-lactamase class C family)
MPSVPRLPLVPDPLRRIHVRRDLESITTIAQEADPAKAGLDAETIEKIWSTGLSLYRSGVHPALQLCLRRHGHVVLDRAIGHARGNGPGDDRDSERVLVTTDTPFCVFSVSRFFEIFREGGALDGVRVMEPETIARTLTEQSRLEIDLSLGFPTRFSLGLMLGAKLLSLYGRDTDKAFGHLGLINIMGWADPERGLSAALITSGKALLYPELPRFFKVMQTITSEVPKL